MTSFLVTASCFPRDDGVLLTLVSGFRTEDGIFLALTVCLLGAFAFAFVLTFIEDVLRMSVDIGIAFLRGDDLVELRSSL